jgi:hypothetical protein
VFPGAYLLSRSPADDRRLVPPRIGSSKVMLEAQRTADATSWADLRCGLVAIFFAAAFFGFLLRSAAASPLSRGACLCPDRANVSGATDPR